MKLGTRSLAGGLAALLCALALTPLLTQRAAAAQDVYISFSDPSVYLGSNVTVTVYSSTDIAGLSLTLVYDTDYLTYQSATGGLGNASVQDGGGSITIVDYHSSSAAKLALSLHFATKAAGTTVVQPTACSVSDASGDIMNSTFGQSAVSITSASSNCDLSALYIDPGALSPAFSSGTTGYTVSVPNSATWLAVSPVLSDAAATWAVSGNDWLNVGTNTVAITVTAGSGAQKTYTLTVTRAGAEPTATPDNSVDEAEVEEPVYVTALDGTKLEVTTFSAEQIPAGFSGAEITWQEKTVAVIRSADGTRTAVYCKGGAGNPAGFYVLDLNTGAASAMNVVSLPASSYVIFDATLSSLQPPAGSAIADYRLGGVTYRAFVPGDAGAQYVIFYALGPGGDAGLYRYDTKEGTMQRLGLSADALSLVAAGYELLDPTQAGEGLLAPEGCTLISAEIGGQSVSVYAPADSAAGYYVVYARAPGGLPGLYVYDLQEQTFQRYLLTHTGTGGAVEDGGEAQAALAEAEERNQKLKWEIAVILVAGAGLVGVVVVLAVLLAQQRAVVRRAQAREYARRKAAMTGEEPPRGNRKKQS